MDIPPAKRAAWRNRLKEEIGGDDLTIDAATDAALAALLEGATVEDAMAAAHSAVAAPRMSAQPSVTAPPVSDGSHLRGRVASFRPRSELMGSSYGTVWDFRVDSWDAAGVAQLPVAVEMRGVEIKGSVGDGDWVEIEGQWKQGEVFVVRSLKNISQNARVAADGYEARSRAARRPVLTFIRIVVAFGIIAFLAYALIGSF